MSSCMDLIEEQFTLQPGPDAKTFPTLGPTKRLPPFTHLVHGGQSNVIRYTICCLQKPDKLSKNDASLVVEKCCFVFYFKWKHSACS